MKVAENSPQNARNCTIFKNFLGGAYPQTPQAKSRSFAARDMPVRGMYIDGHESKPANSNFSNFFLFDKFEGDTFLHNVLKNLVPSMSLYPSFRQLSKPAISHRDTFQRNKTG